MNKGEESHSGLIAAPSGPSAVVPLERSLCACVCVCVCKYSCCVRSVWVAARVSADKSTCERILQETLTVHDAAFGSCGKSGKYEFCS